MEPLSFFSDGVPGVELMAHELGHVLGFNDFADAEFATPFEARSDGDTFSGELAGDVPLADPAHLAIDAAVANVPRAPVREGKPVVTDTEIQILGDMGLPLQDDALALA